MMALDLSCVLALGSGGMGLPGIRERVQGLTGKLDMKAFRSQARVSLLQYPAAPEIRVVTSSGMS
jgi:glucose-6-phosphate-specific signal transduction histidine kinase